MAAMDDYLERCAKIRVDIEALERLMESEEAEVCLRYIFEVRDEKSHPYFRALRHMREKGPFRGKQKRLVGELCKKVGNMNGKISSIKEQWQKLRRALKKYSQNAVATAKLVVNPLDIERRQVKARRCLR